MLLLLVLQHHVVVGLKTNASSEDVDDALSLLGQSVHHGSTSGHFGSLEQIAENGQHRVELLKTVASLVGHGNTLANLSQHHQIHHQRSSQQRILTRVVHGDGVQTAVEDLRGVLIQSTLAVSHEGDVLDHNQMVGVAIVRVQDSVGGNHVVHHAGLGDLLRAELLGR